MNESIIVCDVAAPVARITLNRPDKLNALSILNGSGTPEQSEFDEIAARDGLKAAVAWRDGRYGTIAG